MLTATRERLDELKSQQQLIAGHWEQSRDKDLLEFYTTLLCRAFDVERCSVFINDPANEKVWLKSGTGLDERQIEVPTDGSMVGSVIAGGKSQIDNEMHSSDGTHRDTDKETDFATRNALCVPIMNLKGDKVTGAIQLLNKAGEEGFVAADQELLERAAHFLELSIENIFVSQEAMTVSEKLLTTVSRVLFVGLATGVAALVSLFLYMIGFALSG